VKQNARFGSALSAVSRLVSKLQVAEVCCGGLTLEQFQTLRAIDATPDRSMGALSQTQQVDLSTMSRNVSVLEREGYVARNRHPEDSRVVTVALTRRGREALETLCCEEEDVMAKVYQRLPASARAGVTQALETLKTTLESDVAAAACCAEATSPKRASR
jgi:DNA-binding MarR family transcriptional regulator